MYEVWFSSLIQNPLPNCGPKSEYSARPVSADNSSFEMSMEDFLKQATLIDFAAKSEVTPRMFSRTQSSNVLAIAQSDDPTRNATTASRKNFSKVHPPISFAVEQYRQILRLFDTMVSELLGRSACTPCSLQEYDAVKRRQRVSAQKNALKLPDRQGGGEFLYSYFGWLAEVVE